MQKYPWTWISKYTYHQKNFKFLEEQSPKESKSETLQFASLIEITCKYFIIWWKKKNGYRSSALWGQTDSYRIKEIEEKENKFPNVQKGQEWLLFTTSSINNVPKEVVGCGSFNTYHNSQVNGAALTRSGGSEVHCRHSSAYYDYFSHHLLYAYGLFIRTAANLLGWTSVK